MMEFRELKPEERKYTYAQSQQLMMQCGTIGHMRCDFDSTGKGFFPEWIYDNRSRMTDEFRVEFDEVLSRLRTDAEYGGLLKNRDSMQRYCAAHESSGFEGSYCREYGFRADTSTYAYLIRCNPMKGDYNFYLWAFERKWLDRNIEHAARGIRFVSSDYKERFRIPDDDEIRIITSSGEKIDRFCRYIDDCHLEVGNDLFHICEFAERMEQNGNTVIPLRSSLPAQCYVYMPTENGIGIVKKGESGYYRTDIDGGDPGEAKALVEEMNGKLGLTKAQVEAMHAGSMFGWDTPAADPKNYDEQGQPIKPKNRDRGDTR